MAVRDNRGFAVDAADDSAASKVPVPSDAAISAHRLGRLQITEVVPRLIFILEMLKGCKKAARRAGITVIGGSRFDRLSASVGHENGSVKSFCPPAVFDLGFDCGICPPADFRK